MLSGANTFEISDHQFKPRNPATECDNVTCPAAGEITIRQPQVIDVIRKAVKGAQRAATA